MAAQLQNPPDSLSGKEPRLRLAKVSLVEVTRQGGYKGLVGVTSHPLPDRVKNYITKNIISGYASQ